MLAYYCLYTTLLVLPGRHPQYKRVETITPIVKPVHDPRTGQIWRIAKPSVRKPNCEV